MHFFVEFIRNRTVGWRPSSSGWVTGNCPVCVRMGEPRPDTKQRGGFQFSDNEWVYHCFNCGFKTGWSKGHRMSSGVQTLLSGMGFDRSDIQRLNIELMREEETANLLNPLPEEKPAYTPDWPERSLPEGTSLISDIAPVKMNKNFEAGLVMLSDRHLLHWHDWAYTDADFKYRKRIILPYRYKGKIVGHNARFIGSPPANTPKYIVIKPPHFVFNLDRQKPERNAVIVVEGDFDAISIDGVALGTNSVSNEQASLINQLNKKTVLLPDADRSGNSLIGPAIEQGWHVSFPEWMELYKDANQACEKLGSPFVLKSILSSATDNPTKIRVLAKRFLKD